MKRVRDNAKRLLRRHFEEPHAGASRRHINIEPSGRLDKMNALPINHNEDAFPSILRLQLL